MIGKMRKTMSVCLLAGWALSQTLSAGPALVPEARGENRDANPGFLVVAPDRGFWGNEETRDAFQEFAQGREAELAFVTDERTRGNMENGINALAGAGVVRVAILPLFVSASDPGVERIRTALEDLKVSVSPLVPVSMGHVFGESYLAVETLADRFRTIQDPAGRRVVVVGTGAKDAASRERMEADWQRIADQAAAGFGFESVRALVWYNPSRAERDSLEAIAEHDLEALLDGAPRPVVVPFHLGKKLDTMMAFTSHLKRTLPDGVDLIDEEVTPHPAVAMWMSREANRHTPLRSEDVGVVFLAHGSDYHWNETMRQAVRPLKDRYKIEFAFCMADQPFVERAVRRLEDRGARAIVVVRVFGLKSSFKESVERMLGLDVEQGARAHVDHFVADGHGAGHGHGHSPAPSPPRIRSSALMATVGGLEDHPLFGRALLDRAHALALDPGRETVFLVAHGTGEDNRNAHWKGILESLAGHMRADGGEAFRGIRTATWREDWPDLRAPEVAAVRKMVAEASRDGGRAIVIPARTTGQGPEQEFLDGLDFAHGSGFAPHPLFVRWVEEQVRDGLSQLGVPASVTAQAAQPIGNRFLTGTGKEPGTGGHDHELKGGN